LFIGNVSVISRKSPYDLYDLNLATYNTKSTFNQKFSYGFIPLWGLQSEIGFQVKNTIKSLEENGNNSQPNLIKSRNIAKK
jgi:argininosuccinate synthase